jgi:PAS domain S-box-containing protein
MRDGGLLDVEVTVKDPLIGGPLYALVRDISQTKKEEESLVEKSRLLRTLINAMPDLVWFKDLQGVFRVCNRRMERLFGRKEQDIVGKTDYELWGKEKADLALLENAKVLAAGLVTPIEEEFVFADDGHRELVETAKTPVYGPNGEVTGLLGIARNITRRRQAEIDLTEQTAQMRTLLDALPDLVWMKDPGGVYMMCNGKFAESYGLTSAQVLGKTDFEFSEAERARSYVETDRIAIEKGRPVTFEEEVVFLDGHRGHQETTKAAVHDKQGRLMGVIGIGRDISERKASEAQRAKLLAELQRTQKMESLGTLASGIAHDMNNVLTAILAQATVGTASNPPESGNFHAFSTIARASLRGGKMVKNILSFARQTPAETVTLDLNALLHEEVELLRRTAPADVKFVLDLDPELWKVRGDADSLGGAVMNLCVNSLHAMDGAGTLTIGSRNRAGSVEIRVSDTGAGMSTEVMEKALDPFFTTKPEGKGTGLGLSMVYATVKAHGGELELASEVGRGTTVTLTLPATPLDEGVGTGGGETEASIDLGPKLHVLVVDDDELVRISVSESVEALGHKATVAVNGEAAMALLESGLSPHVVILDLNMPGWGGKVTFERLRSHSPGLPVIFSTGRLDQSALDLEAKGARVSLLAKQYTLEDLRRQLSLCFAKEPDAPRAD